MNLKLVWLIVAGAGLVWAVVASTGTPPPDALREMFSGAFGSPQGWRETLKESTPLLVLGASVFLALKAGLFNIGADGQFVVGGLAAAVVGLRVTGPGGVVLGTLAACLAGSAWALLPGWIKAYRGGHEVITTIMMNNVGRLATTALAAGVLRAPGQQNAETPLLDASTTLPNVVQDGAFRLNWAFFIGLVAVVVTALFFSRTVAGFETAATGSNSRASLFAGIDVRRTTLAAMLVSGAVAGLAGALQVFAVKHQFNADFSPGYGFDALGVALLAAGQAWFVIPSALLFGALARGTSALSIMGVPKGLNGVLLGLVVLVFAAVRYRKEAANG
ncbi:MAG: ABC transporter permease [Armatimonadetes bacterium]|nr:ABC transporter permease [Armatimonadota bacterium]